jgi:hypothetical protein
LVFHLKIISERIRKHEPCPDIGGDIHADLHVLGIGVIDPEVECAVLLGNCVDDFCLGVEAIGGGR